MGGKSQATYSGVSAPYSPAPIAQPQQSIMAQGHQPQPMSTGLLPGMMPTTSMSLPAGSPAPTLRPLPPPQGGFQPPSMPAVQPPAGGGMSLPGGPLMMNQGGGPAPSGMGPNINNMAQPMSSGIPSTMHGNAGGGVSMPGGPVMMNGTAGGGQSATLAPPQGGLQTAAPAPATTVQRYQPRMVGGTASVTPVVSGSYAGG